MANVQESFTDEDKAAAQRQMRQLVPHLMRAIATGVKEVPTGCPTLTVQVQAPGGGGVQTAQILAEPLLQDLAVLAGFKSMEEVVAAAASPTIDLQAILAGDKSTYREVTVATAQRLQGAFAGTLRHRCLAILDAAADEMVKVLSEAGLSRGEGAMAMAMYHLLTSNACLSSAEMSIDTWHAMVKQVTKLTGALFSEAFTEKRSG